MESWMRVELVMWALMFGFFLLFIYGWALYQSRSHTTAAATVAFMVFVMGINVIWQFATQPPAPSPSLTPTPDPIFASHERRAAEITGSEVPAFGPANGDITHPSSGFRSVYADGAFRNFIAQVRVVNPSNWIDGAYNFGLGFRQKPDKSRYRLYATPRGRWLLDQYTMVDDLPQVETLGIFTSTGKFDHGIGSQNLITAMVVGKDGTLFVNGTAIREFRVPEEGEGQVSLLVRVEDVEKANPGSTRYQDFTVWRLP